MKNIFKNIYTTIQKFVQPLMKKQQSRENNKFKVHEWLFIGDESLEKHINKVRVNFLSLAKIIFLFTIASFFLILLLMNGEESLDVQLLRPEYGENTKQIQVRMEAEYQGAIVKEVIDLRILPKKLTISQQVERLDSCKNFLQESILAKNKSLDHVTDDLNLITYHEQSGVSIAWESTDAKFVNQDGIVNLLGITRQQKVTLFALLSIGESVQECSFLVVLVPNSIENYLSSVMRTIYKLQGSLNKNSKGASLELPNKTQEDINLEWELPKRSPPYYLLPMSIFVLAVLYFSRFDRLVKAAKTKKDAIEEEIPNLALQIILLLNAGLVVTAAFKEVMIQNKNNKNPLYEILGIIFMQSTQSNEPFIKAFYEFSQNSGSRSLLRFATMIADHGIRGNELAEKLERERDQMWESRLQLAKSKAKESETKLCMPLMLLLLVLVVISVAPALMEIN